MYAIYEIIISICQRFNIPIYNTKHVIMFILGDLFLNNYVIKWFLINIFNALFAGMFVALINIKR